ncbi:MAG: hypothetical protein VX325_04815 [Bacteroidota bacterium]|nr:hypothetical protein [Bacteroidota bacterium]
MVKNYPKVNFQDKKGPRKLVIKRILAFSKSYVSNKSKLAENDNFYKN